MFSFLYVSVCVCACLYVFLYACVCMCMCIWEKSKLHKPTYGYAFEFEFDFDFWARFGVLIRHGRLKTAIVDGMREGAAVTQRFSTSFLRRYVQRFLTSFFTMTSFMFFNVNLKDVFDEIFDVFDVIYYNDIINAFRRHF
jgi:hypothetical protein